MRNSIQSAANFVLALSLVVVVSFQAVGSDDTSTLTESLQERTATRVGDIGNIRDLYPTRTSPDGSTQDGSAEMLVVGSVVAVDSGPTFAWDRNDETGAVLRREVRPDDPEAMVRMLHIEVSPRLIGSRESAEVSDQSVTFGIAVRPQLDAESVQKDLESKGELVVFLRSGSAVVDYQPALLTEVFDGEGLGYVLPDGQLSFPTAPPGFLNDENSEEEDEIEIEMTLQLLSDEAALEEVRLN